MGFPARIDSMAKNDILGFPAITISNRLSAAFDELQNRIRERAYHIYLDRGSDQGNSVADWLSAQMELVSPIDLEVKTQKKNIVVEANLKGFASKEVEIEIEGNILKIFGTHAEIDKKENKKYRIVGETSREVHFYQSVTLPAPVDIDESHAKLLKNGKLKITLPRTDTGK